MAHADQQNAVIGDTSASTELLLDGDDVVTTATRSAQKLGDSPEAVTVITADQIAASGATSIPELLQNVPGVDVMDANQSQANVAIRGFNNTTSNTLLVMVDGRRINEDFHSWVLWTTNPILLSRIKKIEVVRGPGSVLYGADAFSGVINIILKSPLELATESTKGTITGQYENHATDFGEATYTAGRPNDWAVTLGAGYHGITGQYQGQPGHVQDSSSVPIYTLDAEKKTSRGSLMITADSADSKADFSSDLILRDGLFTTNTYAASYNEDRGSSPITVRYFQSNLTIYGSGNYGKSSAGEFDIQQQRQLGLLNSLTYGATYRGNHTQSNLTGPDVHIESVSGFFLQDQYQIGDRTTFFAGGRDDKQTVYGTQLSTRFSLVNHLSSNQTVRLSYGTAFSAPTNLENYLSYMSPVLPSVNVNYIENTHLKPEQIHSAEAGYHIDLPKGYVGCSIFYNNISDVIASAVIQYFPPPYSAVPAAIQYQNLGTAHADGLELEGGFPISSNWSGLANYSYENVTNGSDHAEDFSPHSKLNLIAQSDQLRRFSAYVAGHYVSSTTSFGQYLRAYTTVDARIAYRLGRSQEAWTAALVSTDLFDDHHREYLDAAGTAPSLSISEPAERTVRIELSGKF